MEATSHLQILEWPSLRPGLDLEEIWTPFLRQRVQLQTDTFERPCFNMSSRDGYVKTCQDTQLISTDHNCRLCCVVLQHSAQSPTKRETDEDRSYRRQKMTTPWLRRA
jgi:hypothetical protein